MADVQDVAGRYNAKRAYMGRVLAERLDIGEWRSETHVIAALWSSEILHVLRRRGATFRALCPDGTRPFEQWWLGEPPLAGRRSALVIVDPMASPHRRTFIGLDQVAGARPRYLGYADAVTRLAGH